MLLLNARAGGNGRRGIARGIARANSIIARTLKFHVEIRRVLEVAAVPSNSPQVPPVFRDYVYACISIPEDLVAPSKIPRSHLSRLQTYFTKRTEHVTEGNAISRTSLISAVRYYRLLRWRINRTCALAPRSHTSVIVGEGCAGLGERLRRR